MPEVIELLCGSYVTVYRCGKAESIVYGSGSDWMAQRADVTNHRDNWRHWFGDRSLAEEKAKELIRNG